MNFLQTEPNYIISFEEILWGGLLVAITMGMHGLGMLWILRNNRSIKQKLGTKKNLISGLWPVILASCLIILVHLSEVMVWSLFFYWQGSFQNNSVSFYFSLNEYTTVGSKFNLPLRLRLLEGMISITGLLTFAWSTSVLFTLAKEFQDLGIEMYKKKHQKD